MVFASEIQIFQLPCELSENGKMFQFEASKHKMGRVFQTQDDERFIHFRSEPSLTLFRNWLKSELLFKSNSNLNLALMLLKYILPHLKSKSSLKIICFMIYTPDQTIFKFQISFKSEINFHVSCFLLTTHHYVYSCSGTQSSKDCPFLPWPLKFHWIFAVFFQPIYS